MHTQSKSLGQRRPSSHGRGRILSVLAALATLVLAAPVGAILVLRSFPVDGASPNGPLVADSTGKLFGTTYRGGRENVGVVYSVQPDGTGFVVLHHFGSPTYDGANPRAGLTLDGAGRVYGTTYAGGASNAGTVFTVKTDGTDYAVLHSFAGGASNANHPSTSLVLGGADNLYGTTENGGTSGFGTVFTLKTNGTGFTVLHNFAAGSSDGRYPRASLIVDGAGNLYGTTAYGGATGYGTVFTLKADGTGFTVLHGFAGSVLDGSYPEAPLVLDGADNLFGTTVSGGASNLGTAFSVKTNGTGFGLLHSFSGGTLDGQAPYAGLVLDGTHLYGTTDSGGTSNLGTAFALSTAGTGFALLHSFAGGVSDGIHPRTGFVLGGGVNLYGATASGGAADLGLVFALATGGSSFSPLYSFFGDAREGKNPSASLILDGNGNLYGTTIDDGASNGGTIFKLKVDGTGFTVLHNFTLNSADGSCPSSALVLDGAGNLYGTAQYSGTGGLGTVYKLSTDGTVFTVLHTFTGGTQDGSHPWASLLLDSAGYLYGTTQGGGANGVGTVFRLRTDGTSYSVLYSFADASTPRAGLISDGLGNLYGTTWGGGAYNYGTVFKLRTDGSGFDRLHSFAGPTVDGQNPIAPLVLDGSGDLYGATLSGQNIFTLKTDGSGFTVLHWFAGGTVDGWSSWGGLVPDGAGNLYGMTAVGGAFDYGTVFRLRTDGTGYTLLYGFGSGLADGRNPRAGLVFDGVGMLYGTTMEGGLADAGTIFKLGVAVPRGTDTPGIYRSSDRSWYLHNSNAGGFAELVFPYGDPSDLAVKGDWDGDGDDTVGIYRNGTFFLKNTNAPGNADIVVGFGTAGDLPIAGDWDGDGIDTIGVYRPAEAAWFLRNSNTPGAPDISFTFGLSNETPVAGDWDGDGIDTVGIFRASDRSWYLHMSNTGGYAEVFFPYGDPAQDVPVVGDWDGDGIDTVGIYRAALGEWFLRNSNMPGNADLNFTYGLVNEKPLAGDWDGN